MMQINSFPRFATLLASASLALLAACGGGGGDAGVPQPTATGATIAAASGALRYGQPALVTVNGANLDLPMSVASPGCTAMTRSTTAPNISTATTAYYTCNVVAFGSQTVTVTRNSDGGTLTTAPYDVPQPTASSATIAAASGALRYGRPALVTVNGANLDLPITVAAPGCTAMTRSTSAPNISTATTAYYTCNVVGVGAQTATITRDGDGGTLTTAPYNIPMPQVTMTVSNGASVNGSLVITLAPDKAPITVDNFLAYVNSGFYNGTIFHRVVVTPTPFVIQGGGFLPITTLPPVAKAGLRPAIVLEDDKGLLNTQWSVAMARTGVADSATSQFFVNLVANTFLDRIGNARGYAVFGSVTGNTALVTAIGNAPCSAITGFSECAPSPNVVISSATQTQ